MLKPIERAIDKAGDKEALAALVGVTPPAVYQWAKGLRPVPPAKCPAIEAATGVRCEELRPELDWQRDKKGNVTGYLTALDAKAA